MPRQRAQNLISNTSRVGSVQVYIRLREAAHRGISISKRDQIDFKAIAKRLQCDFHASVSTASSIWFHGEVEATSKPFQVDDKTVPQRLWSGSKWFQSDFNANPQRFQSEFTATSKRIHSDFKVISKRCQFDFKMSSKRWQCNFTAIPIWCQRDFNVISKRF